jgi:hypothetical protein
MRSWPRWLLIVEILVCFLPCSVLLLVGAMMLPMNVLHLFREPLDWEGAAYVLIAVPCGIVGLCTLLFVVSRLLGGSEKIERPVPVLGGVIAGSVPLLLPVLLAVFAAGDPDWADRMTLAVTAVLPLLATAHILFLSRRMFIAGFRHGQRPLIGWGTRISAALVVSVIALLFVLWRGIGYGALEERRAYWMQHKPAAYTYYSQTGGWLKPAGLGYPKEIRVVGSIVTGASYTFGRGPGDTQQYPPPAEGVWTIDDLFAALLDAKEHGARVQARFDSTTGAVLHARVDHETEDADWSFEVQEFRAIDPEAAQEPVPTFVSRQRAARR